MLIPELYKHIMSPDLSYRNEYIMPTKELLQKSSEYTQIFPSVSKVISLCHTPTHFYRALPDMKYEIPKELHSVMFYLMKYKCFYEGVEWELAYPIQYTLETCNTINELANLFSDEVLLTLTAVDNFIDKVKRVAARDIEFISEYKFKAVNGSLMDLYISNENRIALVEKDLANTISYEDLCSLEVKNNRLYLGSLPFATLLGKVGACSGIYDLSKVL